MRSVPIRHLPRLRFAALLLATCSLAVLPFGSSRATLHAQEGELSLSVDDQTDDRIAASLRQRFDQLEGAATIEVDVDAGVVTLSGTALSREAAEQAVALAERTTDVAEVLDEIVVSTDVRQRLQPAVEKVQTLSQRVVEYLPLLLAALVIFVFFWLLSRLAVRWSTPYDRLFENRFLRDVARQVISAVILIVGLLLALDVLDATALVSAVLGTAGVLGLALGFAFRDLVENYIASILLSLRQPFAPNDHVDIDGREGKVLRLTSRATVLMTLDGNHLRIPNAEVFKGTILNYTRNPMRRFSFGVGVGVNEDLVHAQELGVRILDEMVGIVEDPNPYALVEELGDSTVSVRFYGWVDQREADFNKVRSEAIRLVKTALDDAGIDMPEPIYRIVVQQPGAAIELSEQGPGQAEHSEVAASRQPAEITSSEVVDVSTDDTIDRQMEAERRVDSDTDLLDERAPQE